MASEKILNMVLRKEFALEIVQGKKVREYRWLSDYWARRFCYFEDPSEPNMATGLKWFDIIHFYPYSGEWFLDVAVERFQWVTVDEEFLKEYGSEVTAALGDVLFVFTLGKVLATNLETNEK